MAYTTKGRILIPWQPKESFELAAKVYKKHKADKAASELHNLDGLNWDDIGPCIESGQRAHEAAEKLKGEMEAQYRIRDAMFRRVNEINRASATYLKGKYAKNPKKLAEWGFAVDDTPRIKKAKPTESKEAE